MPFSISSKGRALQTKSETKRNLQFSCILKHPKSQQQKAYRECAKLVFPFLMYYVLIKLILI